MVLIVMDAVSQFALVGVMGLLPSWAMMKGFSQTVAFNVVAILNG